MTFEKQHIIECFAFWDVKEIHVRLNATEAQKAEIIKRASPSEASNAERLENGECNTIWARIYENKSAVLFLPCDVVLTPDESTSLVKTVETFFCKSIETVLNEAKKKHIDTVKRKRDVER